MTPELINELVAVLCDDLYISTRPSAIHRWLLSCESLGACLRGFALAW